MARSVLITDPVDPVCIKLLEDAGIEPDVQVRQPIEVLKDRAVGARLMTTGVVSLEIVDSRPVDPQLYPGGLLQPTQADALARELSHPENGLIGSSPPELPLATCLVWRAGENMPYIEQTQKALV